MRKRILFLDTLRTVMVLLGIVCVVLSNFTTIVQTPEFVWTRIVPAPAELRSPVADTICLLAAAAVLPVLCFISAYFGAASLRMHMLVPYMKTKWNRLGWPLLAGVLLFGTELSYIASQASPQGLRLTVGTFWFLALLLLFHLVLTAEKKWHHLILRQRPAEAPSVLFCIAFYVLQGVVLAGFWYIHAYWIGAAAMLFLYFQLGVHAFVYRWFSPKGYTPSLRWLAAAVLALCVSAAVPSAWVLLTPAIAAFPLLMGLLAASAAWSSKTPQRLLQLAPYAYPLYFTSDILTQNAAYFLQPLSFPEWLKIVLILGLSLIYGGMLCKYGLCYIPCFKKR
ncbi:acyltransferase family protein [uncultured Megasphaera sp.]|uniref:acyltransferase family protein n=1 Tax=uncultured Megasphaera sp. TaxID=165188 RepID=UPI00265AC4C3|nr:acyltransferase family protein [uncultured Megasphaera sp.]